MLTRFRPVRGGIRIQLPTSLIRAVFAAAVIALLVEWMVGEVSVMVSVETLRTVANLEAEMTRAGRVAEEGALREVLQALGRPEFGFLSEEQAGALEDVLTHDNYLACSPATRSDMVVLIRDERGVVGQFDVDSDQVAAFGPADRALWQSLAPLVAPACRELAKTPKAIGPSWIRRQRPPDA